MSFQSILLAFGLLWATVARATEVSNVTFAQSTDGSKLVTVQYTLSGDTSAVSLDLSLDGGTSFRKVLEGARGDIGMNVPPGTRSIEVDLASLGNPASTSAQFRVVALMNPVISEQVVVVDTLQTQVLDVGENTVTFLLAHPDSLGMEVDDILVGTASQPFLRRVVQIDQNGNQVIVTTSPATLVEAIQQGELHESFQLADSAGGLFSLQVNYLAPGVGVSRDQRSISLDGVVLFEGEHEGASVSLTIPDGNIDFTPQIDFQLEVSNHRLQEFRLVAGGELQFDCDVLAQTSGEIGLEHEILLASFSKWSPFVIGYVPVLIKTTLEFHAGFSLDLEAEASLQTGFNSSTEIQVGAQYEAENGWQPVFERDADFASHPLTWELDGTAELREYVRPSVSFEFYGVAGPYLGVEPFLRFAGELNLPEGWAWDLHGGVEGQLGFLITIVEDTLAVYSYQSATWEWLIDHDEGTFNQAPEEPYGPSPAHGTQDVVPSPTLAWDCTDPDGDPLLFDVYLGSDSELGPGDLAASDLSQANYATGPLTGSTSYFWRIVADDGQGHVVDGPVWTFATQEWSPDSLGLVLIPAGDFMMGQAGVATPVHEVTLSHSFLLGRTEVTNQQYRDALQWAWEQGIISATPSTVTAYGVELVDLDDPDCQIAFSAGVFSLDPVHDGSYEGQSCADHPVLEVSWYGAACFCDWLSLISGLPAYYSGQWSQTPSPNNPYDATGYRLPTEAEWEYAAQYEDERTYPWGNTAPTACVHANYGSCVGWTSPVGSYPAGDSELGLQDMAGNVWEWCNDWSAEYDAEAASDPVGPSGGTDRVLRGGVFNHNASDLRCARRVDDIPSSTNNGTGFRLCRSIGQGNPETRFQLRKM
jgi:formylglycine-generating enzyme required for sulfatase activity